ncbi:hypothetical protein ACXET9_15305 [Brachybacterium sp. DNPG3]
MQTPSPTAASSLLFAPASSLRQRPRSRRRLGPRVLVVAVSILLLVVAAGISLAAPLSTLLTLIGLVAALLLRHLPRTGLQIAAGVVVGAVAAIEWAAGIEIISFSLAVIVGANALLRWPRGWLYVVTGALTVMVGNSTAVTANNEGFWPRLITEAVPGIDLHLPVLLLGLVILVIGLGLLAIGTWRAALHLDVLAIALFVAAIAHLAASYLGLMAMQLPMLLAELLPGVYSFDEESLAMKAVMIQTLQMNGKGIVQGLLIPLVMIILAAVRLLRQRGFAIGSAPLQPTSTAVAVLTGVALAVPGLLILILGLAGDDDLVQIILPFIIDGLAFVLWLVAVVAWWRHTALVRELRAPGGDVTAADLGLTLVLACVPALLAAFDVALAFIP